MNTRRDVEALALALCARSACRTKMAAVIEDAFGVFAWGWNHAGRHGLGTHAEEAAIGRANRRRLRRATITIAGYRETAGRRRVLVYSRPCAERCEPLLRKHGLQAVQFVTPSGRWQRLALEG